MSQQNYSMPMIKGKAQEVAAERLSKLTTTLGMRVIKIAQMKRGLTSFSGVLDVIAKKNIHYNPEASEDEGNESQFRTEITGNQKLEFGPDPFPTGPGIGTGLVAYALDDEEDVPKSSKSGATKGWNRDWLASHYDSGIKILDEEVDKDVRARFEHIKKVLEEEKPQMEAIRRAQQENSDNLLRRRNGITTIPISNTVEKHIIHQNPGEDQMKAVLARLESLEAENKLLKSVNKVQAEPQKEEKAPDKEKEGSFA